MSYAGNCMNTGPGTDLVTGKEPKEVNNSSNDF